VAAAKSLALREQKGDGREQTEIGKAVAEAIAIAGWRARVEYLREALERGSARHAVAMSPPTGTKNAKRERQPSEHSAASADPNALRVPPGSSNRYGARRRQRGEL
jgi:hypothetical protein